METILFNSKFISLAMNLCSFVSVQPIFVARLRLLIVVGRFLKGAKHRIIAILESCRNFRPRKASR